MPEKLLQIQGLKTHFKTESGIAEAVDGSIWILTPGRCWAWWGNRAPERVSRL